MNAALDLEAEYNNRARVPEYPAIMAGWERDAPAYRASRNGRCELGIAYGAHPRQRIDVLHPHTPAEAGRPLVVFIHGGYWRSLEPSLLSHFAAGMNARGYSVALPGYRLCPEVAVADIIDDVRAACGLLWRRFGRRIVATGHSAGGHLAAAMAATDWRAVDAALPPDLVRSALAISGVFDLAPLLATSINESLRLDAPAAAATSPANWPAPLEAVLEAWVGERESSEFLRQSRLVAERWAAAGAQTRYVAIPAADHFTAPAPLADAESPMTRALAAICAARTSLDPRVALP